MMHRLTVRRRQYLRATVLILVTAFSSGCGGDAPFTLVKVDGTITYDDGSFIPAKDYRLKFRPLVDSPDGKSFPRVAVAIVDDKGRFELATTQRFGDGITHGVNVVYVERLNPGPNGQPLVPADCTDSQKSPLRIDTNEGQSLTIKVPKPKAVR